jgi:hypothetical protein
MAQIVIDNTSPEAQQRLLEAQVQVAWAKVASRVLHFCTGSQKGDMVEAMREFIKVYESATEKSIDPNGIFIRQPKLDRGKDDDDEHINAILRGSLRMVAAMLEMSAKVPLDNRGGEEVTKTEKRDYNKALKEIVDGVALMQKRLNETS